MIMIIIIIIKIIKSYAITKKKKKIPFTQIFQWFQQKILRDEWKKYSNNCLGLKIVAFSVLFAKKSSHSWLGLKIVANSCHLIACDKPKYGKNFF